MLAPIGNDGSRIGAKPALEPSPADVVQPNPRQVASTGHSTVSTFEPAKAAPTVLNAESPQSLAETVALSKLTTTQRAEYGAVRDSLSGNTQGQDALRGLLLNGKLTGSKDSVDGKTLLDQLSRLSTPGLKLQGGMDSKALLGRLVQDVADPGKISQGRDNYFCGATAVLSGLASSNPAEYARLTAGMAIDGKVTLAGTRQADDPAGQFKKGDAITLQLPPGFQADASGKRPLTEQLLEQPLTQIGVGSDATVESNGVNEHHVHVWGFHYDYAAKGTYSDEVDRMQSAVSGQAYDAQHIPETTAPDHDDRVHQAATTIREQASHHRHPAVLKDGHWYDVTGYDAKSDQVTYSDVNGGTHSEKLESFLHDARAVTFDRHDSHPDAATLAPDGSEGPGGGWKESDGTNPTGQITYGGF